MWLLQCALLADPTRLRCDKKQRNPGFAKIPKYPKFFVEDKLVGLRNASVPMRRAIPKGGAPA